MTRNDTLEQQSEIKEQNNVEDVTEVANEETKASGILEQEIVYGFNDTEGESTKNNTNEMVAQKIQSNSTESSIEANESVENNSTIEIQPSLATNETEVDLNSTLKSFQIETSSQLSLN